MNLVNKFRATQAFTRSKNGYQPKRKDPARKCPGLCHGWIPNIVYNILTITVSYGSTITLRFLLFVGDFKFFFLIDLEHVYENRFK